MKQPLSLLPAVFAALALATALPTGAMAETTVTVTKFHQSYPYTGKATVEYTVGGTLPTNSVAEITINTDDASATFVQSNIVAGANSHVIDFASSFGGALVLTNASFTVTITPGDDGLGGVQLWENGPYWAECNVGASEPEEYGYYFWWGDTVGYARSGGTWDEYDRYGGVTWVSSTGQQMGSSPFSSPSCPTFEKGDATLQSAGYIDSTGNLVAAHDAATAHLGAPWRMPTCDEHGDLINNCEWTWTTKSSVYGYEVRGRDDYAANSIFLPAAGYGYGSYLDSPGTGGFYWSSTPFSGIDSSTAWDIDFESDSVGRYSSRYCALSVRPVRGFAGCNMSGIVTYDPAVFVIESVDDWDEISALVADGILAAEGVNVRLANDIGPVTTTVGTVAHPFVGVFDGGSNTLTVALSGTDYYLAPFSVVAGATIRDLRVAGTVAGGMHCSGLVGKVDGGAENLVEGCEVAAAISSSGSHFGGLVGHSVTNAVTLRGCVFSGSLFGGTYVATFHGWSDDGAATTLIDCLDASASDEPIGRGTDAVCVSNTYYLESKDFGNGERLWSEGMRGKRAHSVTEGEGVAIDFGAPAATYAKTGLAAYSPGLAYDGTFYAGVGDTVRLDLAAPPPSGMVLSTYAASAGTLSQSGSAWTLAMPDGPVVVSANWTSTSLHNKVQLWADGPFWAETNVGADEPWDYGLYFWWGDTVGYKRENDSWAASDGSTSDFSFDYVNAPTLGKEIADLQGEGWITADGVLAPAHDAGHAKWGGLWRMPTLQELDDLRDNCDWIWTTTNGVDGYVVRGRDDFSANSIFLPCAGYGDGTSQAGAGSKGYYWPSVPEDSSQYGRPLYFDSVLCDLDYFDRSYGCSVRPVCVPPAAVTISFDANGGSVSPTSQSGTPGEVYGPLPVPTRGGYSFKGWFTAAVGGTRVTKTSIVPDSAMTLHAHWTKVVARGKVRLWEGGPYWAETNVGADNPWDYGLYFWWGDTIGYRRENDAWVASDGSSSNFSFDEANTPTYNKNNATLQSEGWITADGILVPEHDAAQENWGGLWRIPTLQELADLLNNCDWTWTTTNGVGGYVVRGRDDFSANSIFLPCAGYGDGTSQAGAGSKGNCWASDTSVWGGLSSILQFVPGDHNKYSTRRDYGNSVRPVQTPAPIDLSALTADYTAQPGDVLTGETTYNVTIPGGARVTINGVPVTGGGTALPAPVFSSGGEATTTKFERGAGDTWAITAFAELGNDALGKDVADERIKVYRGDTADGVTNAVVPTITGKKSAVKVEMTVDAPSSAPAQFFRVGFGE